MGKRIKPGSEKLKARVQVQLKDHEFRNLEKLRSNSTHPTNAAYVRALILNDQQKKAQTELI